MQALRCHGYLRIYPAHAGMKHVPTIVAVNTDPNASIFSIAKYGIVADIFDLQKAMASQMG